MTKSKLLIAGLIVLLLAGGLIITGCSDSDNSSSTANNNQFVGTWEGTDNNNTKRGIVFNSNKSWTLYLDSSYSYGTYTIVPPNTADLRIGKEIFAGANVNGSTLILNIKDGNALVFLKSK